MDEIEKITSFNEMVNKKLCSDKLKEILALHSVNEEMMADFEMEEYVLSPQVFKAMAESDSPICIISTHVGYKKSILASTERLMNDSKYYDNFYVKAKESNLDHDYDFHFIGQPIMNKTDNISVKKN